MENIIVWGFCKPKEQKSIRELQKKINVQKWYSFAEDSIEIRDFLTGKNAEYITKPNAEAVAQFKHFEERFFTTYLIMITRRGLDYKDLHELKNEFSCQFYYFYSVLSQTKPDAIIFTNLPHEGPDYILYQTAKHLNIKTIMCYQSLFSNRFFCIDHLEDFGDFKSSTMDLNHGIAFYEEEKPLFYMNKITEAQKQYHENPSLLTQAGRKIKNRAQRINIRRKKKVQKIIMFFREEKHKLLAPSLISFIKNPSGLLIDRPLKRINKKSRIAINRREFNSEVKKATLGKERLEAMLAGNKKIAYFPLHLQPELTTATLGGIYQDQCYAAERLRHLLDNDWIILIKDNPKQKFFQRGQGFYQRLNQLENTYLVDAMYPSQFIIDKADLTVTISGTAGWEAIKSGKKTLVFGYAWYSSLGNCIQIKENTTISDVSEFLTTDNSLQSIEQDFDTLMSKTYLGVVDLEYEVMIDHFDEDINAKNVSNSLLEALHNL